MPRKKERYINDLIDLSAVAVSCCENLYDSMLNNKSIIPIGNQKITSSFHSIKKHTCKAFIADPNKEDLFDIATSLFFLCTKCNCTINLIKNELTPNIHRYTSWASSICSQIKEVDKKIVQIHKIKNLKIFETPSLIFLKYQKFTDEYYRLLLKSSAKDINIANSFKECFDELVNLELAIERLYLKNT